MQKKTKKLVPYLSCQAVRRTECLNFFCCRILKVIDLGTYGLGLGFKILALSTSLISCYCYIQKTLWTKLADVSRWNLKWQCQ